MGKLGFTPELLDSLNLRQFLNALDGFNDLNREQWERTRIICYYAVMPHSKKGIRLSDLWPMDKDLIFSTKTARVYKLSPEEVEQWHAGTWKPK